MGQGGNGETAGGRGEVSGPDPLACLYLMKGKELTELPATDVEYYLPLAAKGC